MPRNQTNETELAIRAETAEVIRDVTDGSMGALPDRYYHNVSHWKGGTRTNHLEFSVWCLMSLPIEQAGRLLTYLESKYIARLNEVVEAGHKLRMAEQEADHEEDMAQLLAENNPDRNERLHYDRLIRHRAAQNPLICYYERKFGPRADMKPAWPHRAEEWRAVR